MQRLLKRCTNVAQTSSCGIFESVCPYRNNFDQILNFTFRLNFRTFQTRTSDLQFWWTRTQTWSHGTRTRDLEFWWTQTRTRSLRTRTRTRESGNSPNTANFTKFVFSTTVRS